MTPKHLVISLSLAGSAAGVAYWVLAADPVENGEPPVGTRAGIVRAAPVSVVKSAKPSSRTAPAKSPDASGKSDPAVSKVRQQQFAAQPLTTEELTARAARVEQEANHDLRRLVNLLDLSEEQQGRVFETLAQRSPLWVSGMQVAPPSDSNAAATTGKRSEALTSAPGIYATPVVEEIPEPLKTTAPPLTGEITAPLKTPALPGEDVPATTPDPMDEILALLNPDQQDTLIQEELDRVAWWAEILPQITPPDDVPAIDVGTPAPVPVPGETQTYEGSDVLE